MALTRFSSHEAVFGGLDGLLQDDASLSTLITRPWVAYCDVFKLNYKVRIGQ
jgi:hypothetical protein